MGFYRVIWEPAAWNPRHGFGRRCWSWQGGLIYNRRFPRLHRRWVGRLGSAEKRREEHLRLLALALCLGISALLIGLGLPRVVASLLKAPAFGSLLQAQADRPVDPEHLETAIAYLKKATGWERSGELYGDLGLLLYRDAVRRSPDDPLRLQRAAESIAALEQSLARTPTVPQNWIRLAYATTLTEGPGPTAAAIVGQSLRLAPYSGALAPARIDLLFRNWAFLSPETRRHAGPQIRYGWHHNKQSLVEIALAHGRLETLRLALRSDPDAGPLIDKILARLES